MAKLRLTAFSGEMGRLIARLLPDNAAQLAFDVRLEDGSLTPMREPRLDYADTGLPTDRPSTIYHDGEDWLYWTGRVNVVPGPVATDRLYFTGDGVPQMRVAGTNYDLAIPAPSPALTASLGGSGTGTSTTSVWVYTNVSQFGEESEPSPVSNEITWQPGNTVTLSGFSTSMGDRTATTQRIYRSQTSTSGVTTFFLVEERTAGTGNYVDTLALDTLQEELPSSTWNNPPADLHSLVSLPGGMMAGLSGKQLCFCEPYHPHAWPEQYRQTLDYEGVALGAFGSTVAVMTTGNPYLFTGPAPESMAPEKLELNLPCINASGVVDLGYAVAYPSNDGLVLVSSGGPRLVTEDLFTYDAWQKLNPESFVAGQHRGRYIASYSYFDEVLEQTFEGTLSLDLAGQQPFFSRTTAVPLAFFYEIGTGALYYLQDLQVFEWDARGQANKTLSWRSKEFVLPKPTNYGAIFIEADSLSVAEQAALDALIAEIEAENAILFAEPSIGGEIAGAAIAEYEINGDALLDLPEGAGVVTVNVYAIKQDSTEKELIATIGTTNKAVRLPSGFLARVWEVEVVANVVVKQVAMAGTMAELAEVT